MQWAAIDFETATSSRDSACAVGIVIVEDGSITAEHEWLIRPPGNEYHVGNVGIHGIHPADTEHAADFDDVWGEAVEVIGDRLLVAHNASFDMGVIRGGCQRWNVPVPEYEYVCTVQLARKTWPGLDSHRLPVIIDRIGGSVNHHDALADARACSEIAAACIAEAGAGGLRAAAIELGCKIKPLRVDPARRAIR